MKESKLISNKFSIIVPVYNAEKYIKKCIDSILAQTYENFEVIIINDGSTDDSWNLLKENYSNKNKIKLLNKKNEGVSKTRNLGIEKATGDWITFVDADDWIEENTLEVMNNIINKNKNIEIIMSNLFQNFEKIQYEAYKLSNLLIDNNKKNELIETIVAIDYGQKKYGVKFGNCRCIGGKFYKLNLIKENNIEFLNDIVSYEDGIFNLYLNYLAKQIYICSKSLYHYFFNNNSRTNTINENQSNQNKLILDNINLFLNKFNIDSECLGYCTLDLFTLIINVVVNKYGIKKLNQGINELKKEYEYFSKYISNNLNFKYLTKKNKFVYYLLKHKMFGTLYVIYFFKKVIKK